MHRTPELPLQDDRALAGLAWYTQRKPVFTGGNSVTLLKGGAQLFPALHEALDKARHTVWMAWYMVNAEGEARRVFRPCGRRHGAGSRCTWWWMARARSMHRPS